MPEKSYLTDDTIAAPFTPPGRGAMSAIRLSGVDAFRICENIFHPYGDAALVERQLRLGLIEDQGVIIDKPLAARFTAPDSFTGEDVVEFHLHGSPYVLEKVLAILIEAGARIAMPGEFSFRAYINGRMDLTEAEGLAALINSKTEAQHRAAMSHLRGGLKEKIISLKQELLSVLAAIEVTFDHPGEIIEAESVDVPQLLTIINDEINRLIETYMRGKMVRDGLRLGIFGRPNVGKSSLMNRLLGRRRAIVADEPGTTRDVIEAPLEVGGIEIKLVDTAGLREPGGNIEALGQDMARDEIQAADIRLILLDGSEPLTNDDISILTSSVNERTIIILNKSDLPLRLDIIELNRFTDGVKILRISCKTGEGIDNLLAEILRMLLDGDQVLPELIITETRHHNALQATAASLGNASEILGYGGPEDIAAIEIRQAIENLQSIIGGDFSEELYSTIFSEFCLGK